MTELKLLLFLAALGFSVTVIHLLLKQAGRDEFAYLTLVLGITIGLIKVVPVVLELFVEVKSVFYYF
ncbi:MAG: SpoIIIAC/SpoIIIAD family protein [Clostridiales bacterium]